MKISTLFLGFSMLNLGMAQAATITLGDFASQTPTKTYATSGTAILAADYNGGAGNVDSTQDVTFAWNMTLNSVNPSQPRRTFVDLGGGGNGFAVTWTSSGIFGQTQDPSVGSQIGGTGTGSSDTAALVYNPSASDIGVSKEWVLSLDVDGTSATLNMFVDGSLVGSVGGVPTTDWAGGDPGRFFGLNNQVLTDAFTAGTGAVGPGVGEAVASNLRLYNNLFVAVPEPSALMLCGLGGIALLLRRRK